MKKFISLTIILALLLCSSVSAHAEDELYFTDPEKAADYLYSLSLFEGTGFNPDGTPSYRLDRTPNREQGLTMLIRLLGEEKTAVFVITNPFNETCNRFINIMYGQMFRTLFEQAENSDRKSRPSEELTAETPAHSCPTSSLPARKANKQKLKDILQNI